MGPCVGPGSCTEREEYVRLKNPTPEARLISRKWTPRKRRVHTIKTCQDIGWCHEVDDIRPPCCDECLTFGPCTECLDDLKTRQAASNEVCGLRCGLFDTTLGINMVCTIPWVGPPREPKHFDGPDKSCFEHGCTDDCPVSADWRDGLEDGPYS